jgi:O-acetyl-ADP-ribose deacetylase (regulator of RNase III)
METIKGDLCLAPQKYIAQQCNCLTVRGHGLAKTISQFYLWADPYSSRKPMGSRNCAIPQDRDVPGTIRVLTDGNNKAVICMFAQWAPGKSLAYSSYPEYAKDTKDAREEWFRQCLEAMKLLDTDEIAFPYGIGCGLAGGNWKRYEEMIEEFALTSGKKCIIYNLFSR